MRILVVDDNDMIRSAAAFFFEGEGHEVLQAQDGHGALAAVDGSTPDAVLMDIEMPGMNGVQATRVLRARKVSALIYAWTAARQELAEAEHLFDRVFDKPLSLACVIQTITADLGNSTATH